MNRPVYSGRIVDGELRVEIQDKLAAVFHDPSQLIVKAFQPGRISCSGRARRRGRRATTFEPGESVSEPKRPHHLMNYTREAWPATIIGAVCDLFVELFPDRIRAAYVTGSRVEESAAGFSDIDGWIIFRDDFIDEAERERAEAVLRQCRLISPLRLDLSLLAENEERFRHSADVRIKLGGRLIYGVDIRDQIELPSIEAYQAYTRRWVGPFLTKIHDLNELTYPLTYPDSDDEFYGYMRRRADPWYPPEVTEGSKEFVATVCWTATALLALESGQFVASRGECLKLSREHLTSEHAELVTEVYARCKVEWDYRVPDGAEQRRQLRALCGNALQFFNYFVLHHADEQRPE